MTNDRSTRGKGGRFTGSTGSGVTPPSSSPLKPAHHELNPVDDDQQETSATVLDAMYHRLLASRKDADNARSRGIFEERDWRADPDETEGWSRRQRRRMSGTYVTFTPDPINPWTFPFPTDVAGDASDAEASIQALNAYSHPALKPLARLLLRTESIASSKAEGLQVEAGNLARAEVLLDEGGKPRSDTSVEILRNIHAMETAIEQASQDSPFTLDDLLSIHTRLMEGSAHAGAIRTEQNWIGKARSPVEADFVPPPHGRVPALLNDLVAAVNDDTLPPVLQAAVVHAQFETIHPFLDGNGRTGRALIHVIWRRRGLAPSYVPPISIVFSGDRDTYVEGLTAFREGRVDHWFTYFSDAASQAAGRAQTYIAQVSHLQEEWRQQVRDTLPSEPRRDAAVWALIDELPAHPAITSARAAASIGRTAPAVNQALTQLEEAGVLRRVNQGARNRIWEVRDLIDLIRDAEK